jgi:hypothetical protein
MLPTEKLNALAEPSREAARLLAEVTLESTERIISLSLEAAQEALDAGTHQLKDTWADLAQVDPAVWPTLISGSVWRGNELSRSLAEIGSRWQKEVASAVGQQVQAFQESAVDAFGSYTRMMGELTAGQSSEEPEVVEVKRRRAA